MAKTPARSYKLPEWDGTCSSCGRGMSDTSFGGGRAGECNVCKAGFSHTDVVRFCRAVASMEAEVG